MPKSTGRRTNSRARWTRRGSRPTPTSRRRSDFSMSHAIESTRARTETRTMTRESRRRRDLLRNLAFLSPWLAGTGLFFLYPLVATAYFSFTHYDGFNAPRWTGLRNWAFVIHDYPFFWPAMRNTLWLVLVVVTVRVLFGLAVGLLVIRLKRGGGFFRTLYYAPYLAPPV